MHIWHLCTERRIYLAGDLDVECMVGDGIEDLLPL